MTNAFASIAAEPPVLRTMPGAVDRGVAPSASAVSWGAIVAGAAAAAALSLILLMLGVGLGLSSVSPWAREGIGAVAFGGSTIAWLTLTQLLASAMGGYLAGRLRTRWAAAQADEVYFRDTAHGFLAWAIASLATAALLTSAVGSIVGNGVRAGATLGASAATAAAVSSTGVEAERNSAPLGYFVDSLFRKDPATAAAGAATAPGAAAAPGAPEAAGASASAEVGRIFTKAMRAGSLEEQDTRHVALLVAQRTGLSQQDAERRVTETYAYLQADQAAARTATKAAADRARKASAHAALWTFISLLAGAFVASLSATWGGRQRDA